MYREIFNITLLQNTIRTATPLILAALGGLLTSHTGILNIGMEGMILLGAFFGVAGSYFFESYLMGILFAVASGIIIGLIFALFVIRLKSDEFIVGIAINMFAGGLTMFLLRSIFGVKGAFSSPRIQPLPDISISFLENIPGPQCAPERPLPLRVRELDTGHCHIHISLQDSIRPVVQGGRGVSGSPGHCGN